MRVYQRYPAAFRSDYWSQIVSLANSGKVEDALTLAAMHEDKNKTHRAMNVIARRIRILRVALFALQRQSESRLRAIFQDTASAVAEIVQSRIKEGSVAGLPAVQKEIRAHIIDLRMSLKKELRDIIWKSIMLGVKNMGDAIKPIIRAHQEAFADELAEVALLEERLHVGLTYQVAGKNNRGRDKATVDVGSDKWNDILSKLYSNIVDKNNEGLTPSQRIWDLTNRLEMDVRRKLVTDIANGRPPQEIADQLQKYIYTGGVDEDTETGPGIYRSPFKSAMRIARTETSRAYADATAAWAENKSWITGIQPTLSPAHDQEDDCDDYAEGEPMDPAEFADTFPVHPHCMCYGTYVIKDEYLTAPDETDNSDQSDQSDQED